MIDWQVVHEQLNANKRLLELGTVPDAQEIKRILKSRAKALAEAPVSLDKEELTFELVKFELANEIYALELSFIKEVYQLKELTPLPCTPSFVMGVINVRGQIISVIDIKKLFGLPDKGLTNLNKVIILHKDAMEFGILADDIVGVLHIKASELQQSLLTLTELRDELLKGVTVDGVVILDALKLLVNKNLLVHEQV